MPVKTISFVKKCCVGRKRGKKIELENWLAAAEQLWLEIGSHLSKPDLEKQFKTRGDKIGLYLKVELYRFLRNTRLT
jgi:hypothetical protein